MYLPKHVKMRLETETTSFIWSSLILWDQTLVALLCPVLVSVALNFFPVTYSYQVNSTPFQTQLLQTKKDERDKCIVDTFQIR
jgi:hypothetical protein